MGACAECAHGGVLMDVDGSFLAWLRVSSTKLEDPDCVVVCPREDGGVIEARYLEVGEKFVEAHVYCTVCGTKSWVRNPRQPSEEQRRRILRYRDET